MLYCAKPGSGMCSIKASVPPLGCRSPTSEGGQSSARSLASEWRRLAPAAPGARKKQTTGTQAHLNGIGMSAFRLHAFFRTTISNLVGHDSRQPVGVHDRGALRASLVGKFIAYFRVSTDRQGQSGLGLEVESGKRNDWPELEKAH
jgi:hypothetical protein